MSNHSSNSDSSHQQNHPTNNDQNDNSEEDVGFPSYAMEGYTPLNFNMNALAMDSNSDDDSDDHRERDGDNNLYSSGYYPLNAPTRRVNGIKTHIGEFASSFHDETDENGEDVSESESDGLVPADFQALAEQALRGLDDEHRDTLNSQETVSLAAPTPVLDDSLDNPHKNNSFHETSLEAKKEDGEPTFEAVFPPIEMNVSKIIEKTTPRKFPAAKMNATTKAKIKQNNAQESNLTAIQQAMKSIRKASPNFASTLDAGSCSASTTAAYKNATESTYNALIKSTCIAIKERQNAFTQEINSHPIIPTAPLAAFNRNTPKALKASHNLSRSATLSEAICRLWPIICFRKKLYILNQSECVIGYQQKQQRRKLTIHIVGADGVECSSEESVRNSVGAFVRWFDAALTSGTLSPICDTHSSEGAELIIEFSGPNMPEFIVGKVIDLVPRTQSDSLKGLESATCSFRRGEYHESKERDSTTVGSVADLTVAFNAGIWGYDSWRPTILSMMGKSADTTDATGHTAATADGTLFVITAYTVEECEDDEEIISDLVKDQAMESAYQMWAPEINLFSSRVERLTESATPGRQYFENRAWQAWLFG